MDQNYFFSWVRKGLGTYIDEKETSGEDGSVLCRPELTVKSTYTARHNQPQEGEKEETSGVVLEKTVKFIGPGDVLGIHPSAVMKVHPEDGSEGFPFDYLPYIEFWEPDFLWRYTPAAENDDKLRPWLAMIVLKPADFRLETAEKASYLTFIGSDETWNNAFPASSDLFRTAHAQGSTADRPEFCRLLGMRNMPQLDEDTEYVALVIPAYETGRLRGLGMDEEDIQGIPAQRPAWGKSYADQKSRKRWADFPVYYKWGFKTGKGSFDEIAKRLKASGVEKNGLVLDVTDMGEGFSYDTIKPHPKRNSILMPAATLTLDFKQEEPFPSTSGSSKYNNERKLYDNLEKQLSRSPVFIENASDIQGGGLVAGDDGDDPMIVPPVYGARHAMSTRIDDPEKPWLKELNMDIHHRAAAGLGRKIVQRHQEELMDRAWKQVEAVQALNMELYERLMSIQTNRALRAKTVDQYTDPADNSKYIEYMMRYLSSMKNAGADKYSLSSILGKAGIPESFAAPSFQNNVEKLSKITDGMDTTTLMDHIVKDQIFRFTTEDPVGAVDSDKITKWCRSNQEILAYHVYKQYWADFFKITGYKTVDNGEGDVYDAPVYAPKKIELVSDAKKMTESSPDLQIPLCPYQILEHLVLRHAGNGKTPDYLSFLDALTDFQKEKPEEYYSRLYTLGDSLYKPTLFTTAREEPSGFVINDKDTFAYRAIILSNKHYLDAFDNSWYLTQPEEDGVMFTYPLGLSNAAKESSSYLTSVFPIPGGKIFGTKFCADKTRYTIPQRQGNMMKKNAYASVNMIVDALLYNINSKSLHKSLFLGFFNKVFACLNNDDIKSIADAAYEPFKSFRGSTATTEWNHVTRFLDSNNASEREANYPYLTEEHVGDVFLACFLFYLPDNFRGIVSLWNTLVPSSIFLPCLCYDGTLGPFMLAMLCHGLSANLVWNSHSLPICDLEQWLYNTPGYSILRELYFLKADKLINKHSLERFIDSKVKKDFPEETTCFNKILKAVSDINAIGRKADQNPATPINNRAVSQLQESIENKDAYEQMRRIAETYYTHFFADDEEGARLRDDYLNDLLRSKYPILAYPIFPEPTYYYLDMFSDKFIIPGLDEIPMDGIAMFKSNPAFTEAYLCGMNTEMGAELQWREYPTDRRGSYFRKFWDSESSAEAIRNDTFFDIKPVHLWEKTKLGENHQGGKGNLLIFAIHSDLFKLYPSTHVYLNKSNSQLGFGQGRIDPVMETFVQEDIFLVGFKGLDVPDVIGNPKTEDYGYLLAFEQDVDDLNFFQTAKGIKSNDTSAIRADKLKDNVTIYGKHVSRFVTV